VIINIAKLKGQSLNLFELMPTIGHGLQLSIEILQGFKKKYLRIIVNASWYVTNDIYILISTCHTLETRIHR